MKSKSNKQLVLLLKEGNMLAFDTLYNRFCHQLHNFALSYLKQEEDAEGIVQEVFLKIWEKRNKIDEFSSFKSFLFTITYNLTISLLRKRLSETKSREHLKSLQQSVKTISPLDDLYYKRLNNRVNSLLQEVTPRQREIYLLSREEGLTHKEIAEQLGISENTVKNHLVSTLKHLRKHIKSNLVMSVLYFFLFI
ncbi:MULTISPECIES: RNA polymerase sigma factor [unclassified Saccharicrinis]|uniref:RNA polymerase sigma factor n=1 Tax=unclassified Saccharicrinis TaxID=2646859 RepID=UPI003D34A0DA